MIDEELYQFATDELNSDRRNSELWNRACALARDDHDEARYLYTNIRVEELLEQHAEGKPLPLMPGSSKSTTASSASARNANKAHLPKGLENDVSLDFDASVLDDSPSSDAVSSSNRAFGANFEAANLNDGEKAQDSLIPKDVPSTPDDLSANDFSLADDKNGAEDKPTSVRGTSKTLELDNSPTDFDVNAAAAMNESTPVEPAKETNDYLNLDALPSVDPEISSLAASATQSLNEESPRAFDENLDKQDTAAFDETLDLDTPPSLDDPLDDDARELIDKLNHQDAGNLPVDPTTADRPVMDQTVDTASANNMASADSDDAMAFLDGTTNSAQAADTYADSPEIYADSPEINDQIAAINERNALREDLERQADTWLPTEQQSQAAVAAQHHDAAISHDYSAPGAGAAPAALTHHGGDDYGYGNADLTIESVSAEDEREFEALLSGRGSLYRVFSRGPDDTRAVRRGMSWTAMLFTFPWLLVKRMPGTALVYALLWIAVVCGLVVSGIHWLDANTGAANTLALWPLAFAVLAVLGLVILPLFLANRWHASSLMGRGYEEIATVRARSHTLAVDRITHLAT